jgi:hypothetical protein
MSHTIKSVANIVLPHLGIVGGAVNGAIQGTGIGKGALQGGINAAIDIGGQVVGSQLIPGITNFLGGASSVPGEAAGAAGASGAASGASSGGGFGSIIGSLSGGNPLLSLANIGTSIYSANAGADAAKKAASQQAQSDANALAAQQNALTQIRGDLQPFRDAGASAVNGLTQLVNDPNAQAAYIQSNPFYAAIADDTKNKLFANAAAQGKVGSGGTAAALQNSLLMLGQNLINQDITQKQNLAALGSNAAAGTGTLTQDATKNSTGLITDQGNSNAAGTIGANNATTGAINNGIGTATSLYGIQNGLKL